MSETAQVIRFPAERAQPRRLVALAEVIDTFGFSERWWRYRIAEGLPVHRWGRSGLRFDLSEVERWMEERDAS